MELQASLPWLALTMTPGIAARQFGSPDGVFHASLTRLESCNLPAPVAQAIFKKQNFWRAEKQLDAARRVGCKLVNWTEPEYPQSLLQIYDPPVCALRPRRHQHLERAEPGHRGYPAPNGIWTQVADRMGRDLASRGIAIVSGPARGVDTIAHQGATAVDGRAIGVLDTGIDVCYPKENKKLCEKVLERGAIVSEFPIGSHPAPENFPVRNRIIAGIPIGVIIVERKQYSGSLITARLAMELGREVFGVPGNVTQDVSFAPNLLIKQGAKLVTNAKDVIEELPTPVRAALVQIEAVEAEQRNLLVADGLSPTEKKIYELMSAEESRPIDSLVEASGLNSTGVLATLFTLEIKGIVRQLTGKTFNKVLL